MAYKFLYYGDNLDILRRYMKDESVDLVYLDPPFNSNASYNVTVQGAAGVGSQGRPSNSWRSTVSGFMACLRAVAT
jgi:DNA modification methylase